MVRALLVTAFVMLLIGCGNPKSAEEKQDATPPKKPEKIEAISMNSASGIRFGPEKDEATGKTTRKKLWKANWQAANLVYGEGGSFSGQMRGVDGEIYANEKTTSTFSAQTGEADKKVSRLVLEGSVVVTSLRDKTKLNAQRVEWLPDQKRILATGNVTLEGEWGVFGPADSLLATPDLRQFGNPNGFEDARRLKP